MTTKRELAKELLAGLVESADLGLRLEYVEAFIGNVRGEEREACAKVAYDEIKVATGRATKNVAYFIAEAIRARKDGDS